MAALWAMRNLEEYELENLEENGTKRSVQICLQEPGTRQFWRIHHLLAEHASSHMRFVHDIAAKIVQDSSTTLEVV